MEESQAPNIKQVIVMRHDLKIRRGKQFSHRSLNVLSEKLLNNRPRSRNLAAAHLYFES